jgi:hypothetical protein
MVMMEGMEKGRKREKKGKQKKDKKSFCVVLMCRRKAQCENRKALSN